MKKKHSLKIFLYAVLGGTILASGCAISAFSFAWFSNNNNVTRGFDGSTTGAYFARGNGSEGNPYVINKPIHLYNLAWLQYVGFFKDKEPYFIIERDLDMSGWTLPPIGTAENPFLGHLDGNDTTHSEGQTATAKISNLTISNSFEKYNGRHPSSQTLSTFAPPEITGLFGVAGDKTLTIEPSVKNLYLNKISIDSATNNALSGVVAGYVNGALSNILINDSSLNLKDGTNKLTGYDSISKYTSVGYCEPNYRTTYVKNNTTMYEPQYVGNASFNPTSGGGGEDQGWGGSISMQSLLRRINYMASVSTSTYSNHSAPYIYNSNIFNLNLSSPDPNEPYWKDPGKTFFNYLNDGTCLPLNINEDLAFAGDEIITKTGTYNKGWHTNNFYNANTTSKGESEIILPTNTGYLVGGNDSTNNTGYVRTRIMDRSSALANSVIISKDGEDSKDSKDSKVVDLRCYTVDTLNSSLGENDKIQEITEENYNSVFKYSKFSKVKTDFLTLMNNSNYVHGFHFMNKINIDTNTAKGKYKAKINNVSYDQYEMIKGGLNFTVSQSGIITSLSGSYYPNGQNNQGIFDIFEVNRDSNHSITSIKKIYKIYKKNDEIEYTYNATQTLDNATLCFDFTKCDTGLVMSRAYYFEFPVRAGDYVIGKRSGSRPHEADNNAYLMYLDIGANAGGTEGTKVDRTKVYELLEQINEGFTYPTGVAIVDFDNAVNDVKKLTITIGSTYSGSVTFNYNGNNNAQIKVDASNSDTGLAYFDENMRINNGKITDSQVHGTITNTETQRLTYFDYDKETKITNVLTFSQTRESSSSAWDETKREDYQSGESNNTFVGVGNLTIYGDDGKSTTDLPELVDYDKINKNTNVFKLKMLTPLEQPLEANWLPLGSIPTEEDAANYYFTLTGYDFTLKKGTEALIPSDYSVTKNAKYALSINGTTI